MSKSDFAIRLRLGSFRLQAGLWPTLATAILLPVLMGLGFWQLQRAEFKRTLQAEYDRYQNMPPQRMLARVDALETLHYRHIVVRGRYEPERQILIDNRVVQGRVGYYVITPLRIYDSTVRVLVNRGWVAAGPDRSQLPVIETPTETVELTGVASLPSRPGLRLGDAHASGSEWPEVWQYLELKEYERLAAFPLQPVVLLMDPDSPGGGLVRHWTRLDAGIQTHQGYALTWFSLAFALAAIYILLNTRKDRHVHQPPES
jgi:surfeit locus 1 family protein